MEIKKIVIAGNDKLSTQIAWIAASKGFEVTLYDPFESNLERWKQLQEEHADRFEVDFGYSPVQTFLTQCRIHFTLDLAQALLGADLVHECYPNNLHLKQVFYKELPFLIAPYTIISTNTTAIPNLLLAYILELDRFVGLQFNTPVWSSSLVEVAPLTQTRMTVLEKIHGLLKRMEMLPMHVDCAQLDENQVSMVS